MPLPDLFDPNFLHGTESGFQEGCKGKQSCAMFGTEYLTCVEVHGVRASDYNMHKTSIFEKILREALNPPALTKPAEPVNAPVQPPAKDDHDEPALGSPVAPAGPAEPLLEAETAIDRLEEAPNDQVSPVNAVEHAAKDSHDANSTAPAVPAGDASKRQTRVPVDDPNFPHGTYKGYSWGCRLKDDCPGAIANGYSCNSASAEYQRDRLAKKQEREATQPVDGQPEPTGSIPTSILPETDDLEHAVQQWSIGDRIRHTYDEGVGVVRALYGTNEAGHQVIGISWIPDIHDDTPDDEYTIHTWVMTGDNQTHTTRTGHNDAICALAEFYVSGAIYRDTSNRIDNALKETTLAEQALRELGTQFKRETAELEDQLRAAEATITSLRERLDEQNKDIYRLDPVAAAIVHTIDAPAPTGGAARVGLTITPTAHDGLQLDFNAGEQVDIRVALAASDKPGLGDVAIRIGN